MKLLTLDSRSSIPQDTLRVLTKNYQKNQRTQSTALPIAKPI
jgi:hypothetical protein